MLIVSWNINGIRSTEDKFLEFLKKYSPDIVLLQEIRAYENQLSVFLKYVPGYTTFFNDSGRGGYGGTGIYYKQKLPILNVSEKTRDKILDSEGRTIVTELKDMIIFNLYTPNGTGSVERLEYKLDYYKRFIKYTKKLLKENKNIIIAGDLNVAHTKLDLYSSETNKNHSGFLPQERQWFQTLIDIGFSDTFRLFNKKPKNYTWWHMRDPKRLMNRGWRFDYILTSKSLTPKVKKAEILRNVFGSDHCPISTEINI